jgi:acyl-CoA thioester hydrolase
MAEPAPLDSFQRRDPTRFRIAVEIRYADLDPNRHVNHARYLIYLEEARLAFRRMLERDPGLPADLTWPVAELTIRYRRAAIYPGTLEVETAPCHVGRTSFVLGYGIFDTDLCVAVATSRSVCVAEGTGRPVKLPALVADKLRVLGRLA